MNENGQQQVLEQAARTAERQRRYRYGAWSEFLAATFLSLKGYRILAWRFRTTCGEIDLVARRGYRLAFIEVKLRRSFAEAEISISDKQRQRIRKAADIWLARHPPTLETDICFDVFFVAPWHWPRHLENGL